MDPEEQTPEFKYLPVSIRLETLGGLATPLVMRGTPLPAKRSETFSTAADSQSAVDVTLFMGERPLARDNLRIGTFRLEGIPPAPRGVPEVVVSFAVDQRCSVSAAATVRGSTLKAEQAFHVPLQLSSDVIARLLAEAEAHRDSDEVSLKHIEATNKAASLIARAEAILASGPDSRLSEAVAALGLALSSGDLSAITQRSDVLEAQLSAPLQFPDLFGQSIGTIFGAPARQRVSPPPASARRTPPASGAALELMSDHYVHPDRIAQLRACKSPDWDLRKLVTLCEELNAASKSHLVLAVGMLVRATLDHVPPIFGCRAFAEVANNYGGARSFKEAMSYLETTSRKIADSFLHVQIRRSEVLPTSTQVDFRNVYDMLLQEIVRILK